MLTTPRIMSLGNYNEYAARGAKDEMSFMFRKMHLVRKVFTFYGVWLGTEPSYTLPVMLKPEQAEIKKAQNELPVMPKKVENPGPAPEAPQNLATKEIDKLAKAIAEKKALIARANKDIEPLKKASEDALEEKKKVDEELVPQLKSLEHDLENAG